MLEVFHFFFGWYLNTDLKNIILNICAFAIVLCYNFYFIDCTYVYIVWNERPPHRFIYEPYKNYITVLIFFQEIVKGDLVYLPYFIAAPFVNGIIHVLSRSTLPRSEYKDLWSLVRGAIMFQRNSNDMGGALSLTPWLKDLLPNYSGYNGLVKGNQCLLDFFQVYNSVIWPVIL